jgi:UPF0755 protein
MKARKIIITIAAFLLAAILVGAGVLGAFFYLNSPPDTYRQPIHFTIETGETLSAIAGKLENAGAIRSSFLLETMGKLNKTAGSFQKGVYLLPPKLTTIEVHDYFISGKQMLKSVTIPEGWTLRKIGNKLEESGITQADDFYKYVRDNTVLEEFGIIGNTGEGFLYPDTYKFPVDYPPEYVVRHMYSRFFEKLEMIYPEYTDLSSKEIYEKVILASIVEREYMQEQEAPLIASVFYNRLHNNMRLQSCATVVYVITEEQGKAHPEKLFNQDLEISSEYNTYKEWGLPPAPISNPGEIALRSAFIPAETNYLYFVLKGDGHHHFSDNYTQHTDAKYYYLKGNR